MKKKPFEYIPGRTIVKQVCILVGMAIGVVVYVAPLFIWPNSELAQSFGGAKGLDRVVRALVTVAVPVIIVHHIGLKCYIKKIKTYRKQRGQCPLCGYPKLNAEAICPECGFSVEYD